MLSMGEGELSSLELTGWLGVSVVAVGSVTEPMFVERTHNATKITSRMKHDMSPSKQLLHKGQRSCAPRARLIMNGGIAEISPYMPYSVASILCDLTGANGETWRRRQDPGDISRHGRHD